MINNAKYAFVTFVETKQNDETFIQYVLCDCFLLRSKFSRGLIFVNVGLKAVSMLLKLQRHFVLIAVIIEISVSHRYDDTNGRSAVTAESDNNGYSFTAMLKSVNIFSRKFNQQLGVRRYISKLLREKCSVLYSCSANAVWVQSKLVWSNSVRKYFSTDLTNGR